MDFGGHRMAAKFFSREILSYNRCKVWLEAIDHENFIRKNLFLAKLQNI